MSEQSPKHRGIGDSKLNGLLLDVRSKTDLLIRSADKLGMTHADTYFSADMSDGSNFRVNGRPIEIPVGDERKTFLLLVLNHLIPSQNGMWEDGQVFTEEYVIGDGGISSQVALMSIDDEGSFDHTQADLPATIWESQANDGLWTFRGKQGYVVPDNHEKSLLTDLQAQRDISMHLNDVLRRLTPGCHDNQYGK